MTAAFNLAQLANNLNTSGQLDATDGLTGAVPIANGGTGTTTANAALNAFLPSQSGNSGRYLTTNGSNTSWASVALRLLKVHTYENSTRQVTSSSTNYTYFTWTLTKVSSTSTLFFHGFMPGSGNTNSAEYIGIGIDGAMSYAGISNVDIGGTSSNFTVFNQIRTGINSGNRTITIQAIPADGSSQRTVDVINPNSTEDPRNRQLVTSFIIYEVENA